MSGPAIVTAATQSLLWLHFWQVVAALIGPRVIARYVLPAELLAAWRADRIAAQRDVIPIELVDALADRLGVHDRNGALLCPGCGGSDYAPVDRWERLQLLYCLTGGIPDVVRAVCLDCGAATRATADHIEHFIPAEYNTTPRYPTHNDPEDTP